jgi:hypothetical protein
LDWKVLLPEDESAGAAHVEPAINIVVSSVKPMTSLARFFDIVCSPPMSKHLSYQTVMAIHASLSLVLRRETRSVCFDVPVRLSNH